MGWRTVLITSSAKLDYQMNYLIVRNENINKIHIPEISTLIIESTAVSITAALLNELMKNKVKVVFCDEKRNPSSELLPYFGSHDTSMKIKHQITWSKDIKLAVWTCIVREKIQKQAEHLSDRGLLEESDLLQAYIRELLFGDTSNREGHAAKVYFNAIFGKEFSRTQENSINAALNYGYSIILSCFTREISANGYLNQLGLFHDNRFNQFNLACDFMEPYRILVDRFVKQHIPNKFEHEEKIALLQILDQPVSIGDRKETVNNAIKIYCRSLFDALNDGDSTLIRFYSL